MARFLAIFLLRSVVDLYRQATHLEEKLQRLVNMLMSTFVRWLDIVSASTIFVTNQQETADVNLAESLVGFKSPFLAYVV